MNTKTETEVVSTNKQIPFAEHISCAKNLWAEPLVYIFLHKLMLGWGVAQWGSTCLPCIRPLVPQNNDISISCYYWDLVLTGGNRSHSKRKIWNLNLGLSSFRPEALSTQLYQLLHHPFWHRHGQTRLKVILWGAGQGRKESWVWICSMQNLDETT